jgi:hypothetical protein
LASKIQDTSAHKGIVFSTSGFQKGALEYAKAHGISAVSVSARKGKAGLPLDFSYLIVVEPTSFSLASMSTLSLAVSGPVFSLTLIELLVLIGGLALLVIILM